VLALLGSRRRGQLSTQVLHEFYAVPTRRLATPPHPEIARAEIRQLEAWEPVPLSPAVRERACRIEDRHRLSCWDALIVAAAADAGCGLLLTEDLQDGRVYEGVTVMNPFEHDPGEIDLR
jgi:predicted nucleic acid-binding protein